MLQVLHSRRMGRNRNKTPFILSVDALTPTCYPTANHIATPAKQPKLADFVVLRIPTGSLPSQTKFIPFVLRLDWIWMGDIVWCECFNSAACNYALNHLTWTQHERGFFIQGFNSCPRAAPWANMHLIASFHWLQRYLKFTLCSVWTHTKKVVSSDTTTTNIHNSRNALTSWVEVESQATTCTFALSVLQSCIDLFHTFSI